MNKIVIAPDSFKGTISAIDICTIISEEINSVFPECKVCSLPIADGGEGTIDAFLTSTQGVKKSCYITGPYSEKLNSYYALIDNGRTAIIEMASAAGLTLSPRKDPSVATSYGVGELIKDAIHNGAKKIIIGLGGSATNDGGCGLASALGVKFYNSNDEPFIPLGATLDKIIKIDVSRAVSIIEGIEISAMCDVTNPLYGPQGAAAIFAKQKGADTNMIKVLDLNLKLFSECLISNGYPDISRLPGSGAAGGIGGGLSALLNIPLISGIELIMDALNFDELLTDCDLVITGEGRIDSQSLNGKVLSGILSRTKKKSVPVCVIAGQSFDDDLGDIYSRGVAGVFTINRQPLPFSEASPHTADNLRYTVRSILNLTKATT